MQEQPKHTLEEKKEEKEKRDKAIKQRVREAILSKGIKIKQFARDSGMAYPSLRDYYSGLRKPGFDAIAAIVEFSGVSGDWILLGKGTMFPNQKPKFTDIDEDLLAFIAKVVAREYPYPEDFLTVQDNDTEEYIYAASRKERQKLLWVREHSLIAGNVYNRIAPIEDEEKREDALNKEVERLVRFHRNMNKDGEEEEE